MSLSANFRRFLSIFLAVCDLGLPQDPTYRFRADEDLKRTEQVLRREQADGTYRPRNRKLARQAFGKKL